MELSDKEFTALKDQRVREAKNMLEAVDQYQYEIAKRCVEVCDIRHGGKTIEKIYTLSNFADDIGLNRKTLSGWVSAYRHVVIKGDITINNIEDWRNAVRTCNILNRKRGEYNKNKGTVGLQTNYKDSLSKEDVLSLYDPLSAGEKPFDAEVLKLLSAAKHINYTLGKRDMNIANTAVLTNLMNELDKASDLINDNLTIRRKKTYSQPRGVTQ